MTTLETLNEQITKLLALVPESQREAAAALLVQYGPRFFELAKEDALQYLRRLMAGDLDVVLELDAQLSDDQFIAKVKANSARWEAVANYNLVRENLKNEVLLKMAPVLLSVLAAVVGL
ncbi:MAG: hypothetical protein NTV86_13125 [Planctomycetota bacterium]|nr:hypothetical protein [Planctomycetota bacterium]